MYIGIKDGKVFDIVSRLVNKRDPKDDSVEYFDLPMNDFRIDDTWDFENQCSLKDAPSRFVEPEETLEEKYVKLLKRVEQLEKKESKTS